MPLEPEPLPSSLRRLSPPRHQCSSTSTCTILLSEIGKYYHVFPKGSFQSRFAPPAIPRLVLHYLDTHPFYWSWTMKAGPNTGKSFAVPTVPTSCPKDSPKAVHWMVSIFHAFKAQLAPQALDQETGRVLPAYIKLYQNNMLMHIRAQRAHSRVGKKALLASAPPCAAPQPVATIPPQPPSIIAELRREITALWTKVQALRLLHEAPTSPPLSPRTAPTVMPPHPPSPCAASSISMVQEGIAHRWLQAVINNQYCPPTFRHIDSSMVPSYPLVIPEDVQQVLQVIYEADVRFVGFNSNGDLCVAIWSPAELIITAIVIRAGAPLPPPPHY